MLISFGFGEANKTNKRYDKIQRLVQNADLCMINGKLLHESYKWKNQWEEYDRDSNGKLYIFISVPSPFY